MSEQMLEISKHYRFMSHITWNCLYWILNTLVSSGKYYFIANKDDDDDDDNEPHFGVRTLIILIHFILYEVGIIIISILDRDVNCPKSHKS